MMTPTKKITARIMLIYLPFAIFGMFGLNMLIEQFLNIEEDSTTQITNIGFGVLGALSAICFSWSRAITRDDNKQRFALIQGERALFAAISFLIASGSKFIIVHWLSLYPNKLDELKLAAIVMTLIPFSYAFGLAYWVLFRIAQNLWEWLEFYQNPKE